MSFPIDDVIARLREAVAPYPAAAMFELRDEGYGSVFEVLVGCVISIRTHDEVTLTTTRQLFAAARTPQAIAALPLDRLADLIGACTYPEPKAKTIRAIAEETVARGGELPADYAVLTAFSGVGPKCANLALGVAADQAHGVAVDVHVHRVTNRWGYVAATTPEKTMGQLERVLPRRYWIEINRLLVPFGKHVCTGPAPRCSTCPLRPPCQQVGVTSHR
ncbi:MAG: endonuclease III [Myxococcales bacterium]|nr:MAG: endonuclease III [Myxococcales bacterium]